MLEREILGCLLQDNSLVLETSILPTYFEKQEHQLIFTTMITLASAGKAIDRVSLIAENYAYMQQLGANFFIELETEGNVRNFETYEKQLIESYKQRESRRIAANWLNENEHTSQLISELQAIEEVGTEEETDVQSLLETMNDLPYSTEVIHTGIKSGLNDLDKIIGGFQKTNSYIIGARPSMGKSATMLKFALEATKQDTVPLIFSLEMSKESLLRRLIATIGNINLFYARNPQSLSDSKKQAWQRAVSELKNMQFEIYDKSLQTIGYIRSQIRKAKRKYNKDVIVFIDYLTLIHSDERYPSDHSKFTAISANLKHIAKDYDCPVITLAQLSRGVEQRQDKRPMLSDLRESGSIEQDADMIMFLYRDDYYNKEHEGNTLEIIVAKHRDGGTGTAEVYYQKETGRMGDIANY